MRNKKRLLCSLLTVVMLCSLMTGCDNSETPTNTKEPVSSSMPANLLSTTQNSKNVDNTFSNITENEVQEILEEKNMNITDFSLFPTEDKIYPLDIGYKGKILTLYVEKEVGKKIDTGYGYSLGMAYELIMPDFSMTKGGMYESSNSVFGNAINIIGDAFTPSLDKEILEQDIPKLNTSEYNDVKESSYLSVKTSPLSTFAADVDTASYTNFRQTLKDSFLLDEKDFEKFGLYDLSDYYTYSSDMLHDVRIEEMINYFDFTSENTDEKFTISAEIGDTPWNSESKLLVVNVKAKELPKEEYKGSNLVFLIDTSGSMDGPNRLPLLKECLYLLIEQLSENDTVSIVTYSGDSAVLADGLTGANKEELVKIIKELGAYGSTNGEGGIKAAYKIAEKYKNTHSNSRIIMCSDGDLNVGVSSESELVKLVEKERKKGVYLSVLGFGSGNYKDNKMEAIADNGNGNYYYIDTIKEGQKVLVEDIMSTLVTLADDVKFQLEFNPEYIKGYRKIGYENRDMANEDFADDTKDGGEVGYGHEVTVVYELVPVDSAIEINESDLKYQNSISSGSTDWLTVNIRYKEHGEKTSKLLEYTVNDSHVKTENSDNWKFISDIVGLGLLLNDSEYKNNLTVEDIINSLDSLDLSNDNYKTEFKSLVYMYEDYLKNIK